MTRRKRNQTMNETIDAKQIQKWLDFVNKHKPTDLDIEPEACAQLLANQEKFKVFQPYMRDLNIVQFLPNNKLMVFCLSLNNINLHTPFVYYLLLL